MMQIRDEQSWRGDRTPANANETTLKTEVEELRRVVATCEKEVNIKDAELETSVMRNYTFYEEAQQVMDNASASETQKKEEIQRQLLF